jgi:hypothetical protein
MPACGDHHGSMDALLDNQCRRGGARLRTHGCSADSRRSPQSTECKPTYPQTCLMQNTFTTMSQSSCGGRRNQMERRGEEEGAPLRYPPLLWRGQERGVREEGGPHESSDHLAAVLSPPLQFVNAASDKGKAMACQGCSHHSAVPRPMRRLVEERAAEKVMYPCLVPRGTEERRQGR